MRRQWTTHRAEVHTPSLSAHWRDPAIELERPEGIALAYCEGIRNCNSATAADIALSRFSCFNDKDGDGCEGRHLVKPAKAEEETNQQAAESERGQVRAGGGLHRIGTQRFVSRSVCRIPF